MNEFIMLIIVLVVLVSIVLIFLMQKKKEDPIKKEQIRKKKKDLLFLEEKIETLKEKGHNDAEILAKLVDTGWDNHVVELVMKKMHKTRDIEKLQAYVDKQILSAKELELIKEELLDMGWTEEVVDSALGLVEPKENNNQEENNKGNNSENKQ